MGSVRRPSRVDVAGTPTGASKEWVPPGSPQRRANPGSPGNVGHGAPVWVVTQAMRRVQTEEVTRRHGLWQAERRSRLRNEEGGVLAFKACYAAAAAAELERLRFACEAVLATVTEQEDCVRTLRVARNVCRLEALQLEGSQPTPPDTPRGGSPAGASGAAAHALSERQLCAVAQGLRESAKKCPVKERRETLAASRGHLRQVCEFLHAAWRAKPGGLLDELLDNLASPPPPPPEDAADATATDVRETRLQILATAADHLYRQKRTFYPTLSRVELLALLLYTMAGPDIDSLMSFQDVPDYDCDPDGWAAYCALHKDDPTRNSALFSEINWALRTAPPDPPPATAAKAAELTGQYAVMWRWAKFIVLLTSVAARPNPVGTELARGLAFLPEGVVLEYLGQPKNGTFYWPALSSCALDVSVSESYIAGTAANAMKKPDEATAAAAAKQKKKAGPAPPPLPTSILFLIRHAHVGVNLEKISKYPKEAEHLLPIMSAFTVDSLVVPATGVPADVVTAPHTVADGPDAYVTVRCSFAGLYFCGTKGGKGEGHAAASALEGSGGGSPGGGGGTAESSAMTAHSGVAAVAALLEDAKLGAREDSRRLRQRAREAVEVEDGDDGDGGGLSGYLSHRRTGDAEDRLRHTQHTGSSFMKTRCPEGSLGSIMSSVRRVPPSAPSPRLLRPTASQRRVAAAVSPPPPSSSPLRPASAAQAVSSRLLAPTACVAQRRALTQQVSADLRRAEAKQAARSCRPADPTLRSGGGGGGSRGGAAAVVQQAKAKAKADAKAKAKAKDEEEERRQWRGGMRWERAPGRRPLSPSKGGFSRA